MPYLRHLATGDLRQLTSHDSEGELWAVIGSAENVWWRLAGLEECHGSIVQSSTYHSYLLLELDGKVAVNNLPVVEFRVLRHRDQIQLGEERFTFIEVLFQDADEKFEDQVCSSCGTPFEQGEKIVQCPKCGDRYHRDCWLNLDMCGRGRQCAYPVRGVILEALADTGIRSESVRPEHPILAKQTKCPSTERHDHAKLIEEGDDIIHCPDCGMIFHEKCWMIMERCSGSGCHFSIQSHLHRTFSANPDRPEEEDIVQCPECKIKYRRSDWINWSHCVNIECMKENPHWIGLKAIQPPEGV